MDYRDNLPSDLPFIDLSEFPLRTYFDVKYSHLITKPVIEASFKVECAKEKRSIKGTPKWRLHEIN
jgi:hypothetical protein